MEKNDQADFLRAQSRENLLIREKEEVLPSRSQYHGRKKTQPKKEGDPKKKKKNSFTLSKWLLAAFLLLVLSTLTYPYWSARIQSPASGKSSDSSGFEKVSEQ